MKENRDQAIDRHLELAAYEPDGLSFVSPRRKRHPPPGSLPQIPGRPERLEKFGRTQRLRRSRKVRGLSARQLMERKMGRRAKQGALVTTVGG